MRAIEKCCFIGAAAVSAIAAIVLVCFPDAIAGLFLEDLAERPDFAVETEQAVRLFALTYLTRWFPLPHKAICWRWKKLCLPH